METRWYVIPGENIETTKLKDRRIALHITRDAWGNILKHLDRNRLIQEAIEKQEARNKALKEGSTEMTKNWPNSLQNKRKREEEERKARIEKEEADKMQKFLEIRREQEDLRQKYIANARKTVYISQGHPRNLNGALILSEVLHEREKQQNLDKVIKQYRAEEEALYAKQVKEAAEQEKLEKLEKERKLTERKLELRNLYLDEINERERQNQMNKETKIAKEREDHRNAHLEHERIKQVEHETEKDRRLQIKNELQQFYEKQQKAKELAQTVEKEQDLVIDIYSTAKHKIDCLRMKREREMQLALQARREAAAKQVIAEAKAKTDDEERIMRKAMEETELEELKKLKQKEETRNRLIKDRQEDRKKFIEREEKRKFKEMELKKWLLLNRCKRNEVSKQHDENRKREEWQKKLDYRKALFEQMAEDEERHQIEEADNHQGYDVGKFAEDDKKFFEYAEECLQYARNRGRSTAPVERVILEYKKENRLPIPLFKTCQDYNKNNTGTSQDKKSSKGEKGSKSNEKLNCKKAEARCKCFK